jgi:hypothetical protein
MAMGSEDKNGRCSVRLGSTLKLGTQGNYDDYCVPAREIKCVGPGVSGR